MLSTLFTILFVLVIIGLILYLVNRLPIDANIKTIIYVLVIIVVLAWLLNHFGILA
jgi:hypothetical protein